MTKQITSKTRIRLVTVPICTQTLTALSRMWTTRISWSSITIVLVITITIRISIDWKPHALWLSRLHMRVILYNLSRDNLQQCPMNCGLWVIRVFDMGGRSPQNSRPWGCTGCVCPPSPPPPPPHTHTHTTATTTGPKGPHFGQEMKGKMTPA